MGRKVRFAMKIQCRNKNRNVKPFYVNWFYGKFVLRNLLPSAHYHCQTTLKTQNNKTPITPGFILGRISPAEFFTLHVYKTPLRSDT